jgi:hypothetical protein
MTVIESACRSRAGNVESTGFVTTVSGGGAGWAIAFRNDLVDRQPAAPNKISPNITAVKHLPISSMFYFPPITGAIRISTSPRA